MSTSTRSAMPHRGMASGAVMRGAARIHEELVNFAARLAKLLGERVLVLYTHDLVRRVGNDQKPCGAVARDDVHRLRHVEDLACRIPLVDLDPMRIGARA